MNAVRHFLHFLAGVDSALLSTCPHHERLKYTSIGVLVLITGILATLSSAYAVFFVFESRVVSILLGLVWGLYIVNLDRLILSTYPKTAGTSRQALHAAPRLVLAVAIGITIGHPMTLRLFEPDILQKIAAEEDVKRSKLIKERDSALRRAQIAFVIRKKSLPEFAEVEYWRKLPAEAASDLSRCEEQLVKDKEAYRCEADGTCGTMIKTCGPVCKEKKGIYRDTKSRCGSSRKRIDKMLSALANAEKKLSSAAESLNGKLEKQKQRIEDEYKASLDRLVAAGSTGYLARTTALNSLTSSRNEAAIAHLFIMLLFILVEIVPVLLKAITPADSADHLAAGVRKAFIAKIPEVAESLSEPTPVPKSSDTDLSSAPHSTPGVVPLRYSVFTVALTIVITAGMLAANRSISDAASAGTLFLTAASYFVVRYRRTNGTEV